MNKTIFIKQTIYSMLLSQYESNIQYAEKHIYLKSFGYFYR